MPWTRVNTLAACVAAVVGTAAWVVMMASAPRYSGLHGTEEDLGSDALYPLLLGAALAGGFLVPRSAAIVGLCLGLPAVVLSPFTAPRGDHDGLWVLIVPILLVFMFVLVAVACVGGWLRSRVSTVTNRRPPGA